MLRFDMDRVETAPILKFRLIVQRDDGEQVRIYEPTLLELIHRASKSGDNLEVLLRSRSYRRVVV